MRKLLFILFGGCLLYSCSPKYYIPNTQNVPLLTEKGETNLTVAGNANQAEVQGAYAITNGLAVKANAGLFIPSDQDNGNGGSGKFIELGAGYFKPLEHHFVFEAYGIAGIGSVENHFPSTVADYPQTSGEISATVFRYGLQTNFGYKIKHFSAGLSSRFVHLNYSNIEGNLIYDNTQQTEYLEDNRSNFLIEPALTIRGGFEKFKIQAQYGYSFNLSNSEFKQDNAFVTLGLNFNFK